MHQDNLQQTPFQPYMFTRQAVLTTGSHWSVTLCWGEAWQSLWNIMEARGSLWKPIELLECSMRFSCGKVYNKLTCSSKEERPPPTVSPPLWCIPPESPYHYPIHSPPPLPSIPLSYPLNCVVE